jgi:hypothetical protein
VVISTEVLLIIILAIATATGVLILTGADVRAKTTRNNG